MDTLQMVVKKKKNTVFMEKLGENLSIRFLKKRMRKLNNELGFMSGYVFKLRGKINDNLRLTSCQAHSPRDKAFGLSQKSAHLG